MKFLPFRSNAWNIIFHLLIMPSHSDFLLKSQEFLFGERGVRLKDIVLMLTILWSFQLLLLGYSQNSIVFSWWWLKNFLRLLRMRAACFWSMFEKGSKIFFAAWMESVTTMILDMFWRWAAWLMLYLIAKNSASVLVMLTTWWRVLMTSLLWTWICAIDDVMLFLTLASVTTSVLDGELEDSIARLSSCWMWFLNR